VTESRGSSAGARAKHCRSCPLSRLSATPLTADYGIAQQRSQNHSAKPSIRAISNSSIRTNTNLQSIVGFRSLEDIEQHLQGRMSIINQPMLLSK
jgi:hypothetical protein